MAPTKTSVNIEVGNELRNELDQKQKPKVWTTLLTNSDYLTGVLTLDYSLKRVQSKYPLVALCTDAVPCSTREQLTSHGIAIRDVEYLLPSVHKDYSNDTRFYDCWSKLQPFNLTEYSLVGQLDSDMVICRNMDELLSIPLDEDDAPFAASHACVCNPYNKAHYPPNWTRENCAYTNYSEGPEPWAGPSNRAGLALCNGGLQIVVPSLKNYRRILGALSSADSVKQYEFADQSLLSDVFKDKWVPLSYRYNALKTLKLIHADVWSDCEVKNIHYIINPKPWDTEDNDDTGTFNVWHMINRERLLAESRANLPTTLDEAQPELNKPKVVVMS